MAEHFFAGVRERYESEEMAHVNKCDGSGRVASPASLVDWYERWGILPSGATLWSMALKMGDGATLQDARRVWHATRRAA